MEIPSTREAMAGRARVDEAVAMDDMTGIQAFKLLYPMYVITVEKLLELPRLLPHNKLLASGSLTKWTPELEGKVIVVSHQWLSFERPDPENEHFFALCRLMQRITSGSIAQVEDYWVHRVLMLSGSKSFANWRSSEKETFVWIDICSMPQVGPESGHERIMEAGRAIQSLPGYVERSNMLLILAPVCRHKESGEACNYASWRTRGWCRLELMSAILAPRRVPAMVCTGAEALPFFVHPLDGPRLSCREAKFSCCALGHRLNGERLPCDKLRVAAVLETMLEAKVMRLRGAGRQRKPELHFYNSLRHVFTRGLGAGGAGGEAAGMLACRDPRVAVAAAERQRVLRGMRPGLQRLKALLSWKAEDEEDGRRTGFGLVMCAALADDALALRQLLESGSREVNRKEVNRAVRRNHADLAYMQKGATPFSAAMIYGSWESCEVLLAAGADPKRTLWNGMDCLFSSACIGNLATTRHFLQRFPAWDVNRINSMFNMNPLLVAAISLTKKRDVLECLLAAGADAQSERQCGQQHALLCLACTNEDSDHETVRFLLERGADINGRWRPHDMKYRLTHKALRALSEHTGSRLFKELAMHEGATPLHFAAKRGDVELVEYLLDHRADPEAMNRMGKTPLRLALDFFGGAAAPTLLKEAMTRAQCCETDENEEPPQEPRPQQPRSHALLLLPHSDAHWEPAQEPTPQRPRLPAPPQPWPLGKPEWRQHGLPPAP